VRVSYGWQARWRLRPERAEATRVAKAGRARHFQGRPGGRPVNAVLHRTSERRAKPSGIVSCGRESPSGAGGRAEPLSSGLTAAATPHATLRECCRQRTIQ
jgi:hypothetical protein